MSLRTPWAWDCQIRLPRARGQPDLASKGRQATTVSSDGIDLSLLPRPPLCMFFLWVLDVKRSWEQYCSWMLIRWDVIIVSSLLLVVDWFRSDTVGCAWCVRLNWADTSSRKIFIQRTSYVLVPKLHLWFFLISAAYKVPLGNQYLYGVSNQHPLEFLL